MKELRLVLLGLAAIIAVLLGAGFLTRAFTHAPSRTAALAPATPTAPSTTAPAPASPVRTEIDRDIAGSPDYAKFFDRLRTVFPNDYESILNGVATNTKPGEVNVDLVMADVVTALRRAHGALATKASDSALEQIFDLQLREMKALAQRDPHLCVAFLYGANGRGFLGFASENRALIADAAIAGLDAMNSGRSDQIARGAPTDDDFQTLDHALVTKGLTRPQIDELLDGKTADPPIADPADVPGRSDLSRDPRDAPRRRARSPVRARGRPHGPVLTPRTARSPGGPSPVILTKRFRVSTPTR